MEKPILQIPQKKYSGESSVISMRIPKDMLADIDQVAEVTGRTRNEILTTGLEFALNHMIITAAQGKTASEPAEVEQKKKPSP